MLPLGGRQVRLFDRLHGGTLDQLWSSWAELAGCTTEPEGRCSLGALAEDEYLVVVQAPGVFGSDTVRRVDFHQGVAHR